MKIVSTLTCISVLIGAALSVSDVRLQNSSFNDRGRVEILHNGIWGTICDDGWTDDDAILICRMLNYGFGKALVNENDHAVFGEGAGKIWLDELNCSLGYTIHNVSQCRHRGWGIQNCHHNEDAGVICTGESEVVRLVGGKKRDRGRVQILRNGKWGTICDDHFGDTEARAVCRLLGFRDGKAYPDNVFGIHSGKVSVFNLNCSQSQWNLQHKQTLRLGDSICYFDAWTIHPCTHGHGANVWCVSQEHDIVLVNGTENNGIAQTYQGSKFHYICESGNLANAADIVCHSLGYSSFANQLTHVSTESTPSVTLHDLNCRGTENRLDQCPGFDIQHTERCRTLLSINCLKDIRIRDGQVKGQGRVEIFHDNRWGTICSDDWDNMAATVACRSLGYLDGKPFRPVPGNGTIWLDNVRCTTSHYDISKCRHNGWGNHNCDHYKDAGVWCVDTDEGIVLIDGTYAAGRVELFSGNSFGSICNGRLDASNADVLCRLSGHRFGGKIYKNPNYGNYTFSYLRNLKCNGTEVQLGQCTGDWRHQQCSAGQELWINCATSCDVGMFGQTCAERCHCQVPGCDPASGVCTTSDGGCEEGWTGNSCAIALEKITNNDDSSHDVNIAGLACLSVLLAASIIVNIGLYIKSRRIEQKGQESPEENISHYENLHRADRNSVSTTFREYDDIQMIAAPGTIAYNCAQDIVSTQPPPVPARHDTGAR